MAVRNPLARLHAHIDRFCYMKTGGSAPLPDPAIQTNAEAAANRYNINSPFGSQTWEQSGKKVIGYDSTGNPQYGSDYTQNIDLNDSEQKQYDTHNQIAESLLNRAQDQIPKIPSEPFQFNKFSYSADNTPDFNYDQATPEVAKAQYQKTADLLNPQFDRQNKTLDQSLANRGIPIGSEAYDQAIKSSRDSQNMTLSAAAQDATTEGSRLAADQFNMGQARRDANANKELNTYNTNAQGDIASRQQNYNELAGLLGGQQLNPVNAGGGGGAAPVDVGSAYGAYNAANQANAANKTAANNANLGAVGTLGTAAAIFF